MPSGKFFFACSMKARTRSAVATALAPGARYTMRLPDGLSAHAAEAAIALRAELDAADVAEAQQRGVRPGAQDDVLELHAGPPAAPERSPSTGKPFPESAGGWPDGSRRVLPVLRLDGRADIGGGDARAWPSCPGSPTPASSRSGSDPSRASPTPVQAGDLVQQVDLRVVVQEQRVVAAVLRDQADCHQERAGNFLHGHALRAALRAAGAASRCSRGSASAPSRYRDWCPA